MADLIDRISGAARLEGRPKLNVHAFVGGERMYAMGEVTRAEVATAFDLQGDELTQGAALADNIDAQANVDTKIRYVARVEAVAYLVEDADSGFYRNPDGTVDKAAVLAALQIGA
jgi:hypothetical protein